MRFPFLAAVLFPSTTWNDLLCTCGEDVNTWWHQEPMSSSMQLHYILIDRFRAWLHGEFQPGLKFRSAHQAEILLRLHAQFQPGRKTQISVRKFTEVRKHNRYACSRSFFSPGWKNDNDYMDFSARLARLKILARFENTGLGFSSLAESISM